MQGSGKSLTATKKIVDSKELCYTNFHVRTPHTKRLKYAMILEYDENNKPIRVNWDYWKDSIQKYGGFNIVIDELHNLLNARRSMTKDNILITQWVAQLRKVTGENEVYDFLCISQELMRIDIAVRDLAHEIIVCEKFVGDKLIPTIVYENGRRQKRMIPEIWIMNIYFTGQSCVDRYERWKYYGTKSYNKRNMYRANSYLRFYDSYEIVNFGETELI